MLEKAREQRREIYENMFLCLGEMREESEERGKKSKKEKSIER